MNTDDHHVFTLPMREILKIFEEHCSGTLFDKNLGIELTTFMGFFDKKTGSIYIPEKNKPSKMYLYEWTGKNDQN